MWLTLYENRPLFLILGQWREGKVPIPFSGGCDLQIQGRDRHLLYFSGLHLIHFTLKGREIFLLSNLTLNDLLGLRWEEQRTAVDPIGIPRAS